MQLADVLWQDLRVQKVHVDVTETCTLANENFLEIEIFTHLSVSE